jgi:hypothetical protein
MIRNFVNTWDGDVTGRSTSFNSNVSSYETTLRAELAKQFDAG